MIGVNGLRKGTTFTMDGELYKVLEYQHHKPGRGKATIRTTLRNIRTGATIQHNFISGDRVEDIRIERRGVQYLYTDGDLYYYTEVFTDDAGSYMYYVDFEFDIPRQENPWVRTTSFEKAWQSWQD